MNIVKGVADLLRRTSGGQSGESPPWGRGDRFSAPSTRIHFGDTGQEAVLNSLWQKYESCIDKTEKRKLLQIFLMQFIQTFKNWEPDKEFPSENYLQENNSGSPEVTLGCSHGHPSEVILILIQELVRMTSVVTEMNNNPEEQSKDPESANFNVEVLHILSSLDIITRSVHNCRVFSYYGGVQKVVALLKAAVVQLKTSINAFSGDEHLSSLGKEKVIILHNILLYVVSIIFSFTNLNAYGRTVYMDKIQNYFSTGGDLERPSINSEGFTSEVCVNWQQKAAVMVLEAGGLNWLVELLRVIRRLNLKERGTVLSLQYLTLSTLRSALLQNPRSQNHFRLIGGLEVLLDGLGLPSNNCLSSKDEFLSQSGISGRHMFCIFQLQILSLEVLRESIFGNMNNLQFLRETGRIQKFANSLCWPVFLFQEFRQWVLESGGADKRGVLHSEEHVSLDENHSFQSEWNLYVMKLSRAICSFLLPPEDITVDDSTISSAQARMPVSLAYCEDSSRWIIKVMFVVFPCIKACSTGNEPPNHLRIFSMVMQKRILYALRKLLVSAPGLLEAFREEDIWDLIFSEHFFYSVARSEETSIAKLDVACSSKSSGYHEGKDNVDTFQMEVISFVEFAATLNGNKQNQPECGSLLDALEKSACNPEISIILLRSLHRILQLSFEQTIVSFNALDAACRILKVACIEAEEYGKLKMLVAENKLEDNCDAETTGKLLLNSMEACVELFSEYLLSDDNGKSLVIQNAPCIECLFILFWVESLRDRILGQILSLLKTPSSSPDDRTGKLQLCSKYIETFTHAKEREKGFVELSVDLLVGLRNVIMTDQIYYQTLFCEAECFLHIISLLNDSIDKETGEHLVLNVLETLTSLLGGNTVSKVVFRGLVGVGYQMLQSLLMDFFQFHPSMNLLNALLDMLVDGKFDHKEIQKIKNEDVVLLFINILRKSSDSLKHYGLGIFQALLRDSIPNRTSCCRAGMLSLLLDWFPCEEDGIMITMIAQLIQVIGGHSVTGKDLRKFFALLRNEKIRLKQNCYTLLLNSIEIMLREKGPTAFFEFNGIDSGLEIKTPVQWSHGKGFSFTCWIRVETFPIRNMGLFCFLTDNGKGWLATLGRDKIVFESINQKKQSISLPITMLSKRWHFMCITHSIGRAFSGGSILKCYIDGILLSSDKCRYPKISENFMHCTIGMKPAVQFEDTSQIPAEESFPFMGQMGPAYLFGEVLSPDQIKGIYFLGPNYMYSFSPSELSSNLSGNGSFHPKDSLSTKVIFGLNAQASDGRTLFNALSSSDHMLNAKIFEAGVRDGTQICSRRMLQDIIYCVGGVSVFFPLLVQLGFNEAEYEEDLSPVANDNRNRMAANVLELITSVLDDNLANQRQMHLLSGFSILGFLLQSVSPRQINMHTFLSLKRMLDVLKDSGNYELLSDAVSWIYFNSHIWMLAEFNVQRELYMLLIQYFENDSSLLIKLCQYPCILDTIHNFYCENLDISLSSFGIPHSHSPTKIFSGQRLNFGEVRKIRLLLLSLAEMSLRQKISVTDVKALASFLERSQDLACIEDMLLMVIRLLSQKPLLSSFLEQVDHLGGCQIFINLLDRDSEQIRLLALQFMGELLVGLPLDKKGSKIFSISVGRPKFLLDGEKKEGNIRLQIILAQIGERMFKYPLSENLSATLFDVLLGGASPRQVLQKRGQVQLSSSEISCSSTHFILPSILALIFKFLVRSKDRQVREKILTDLIDLLDSNPSNVEALMEIGWSSWLEMSVSLYASENIGKDRNENEQRLVRSIFCIVLSHCTCSIKGGWRHIEETVNYLLLAFRNSKLSNHMLLQHIFEDLMESLSEATQEENIMLTQPCRDNTLYLLKLVDEMLMNENDNKSPFPMGRFCTIIPCDLHEMGNQRDIAKAIEEIFKSEGVDQIPRIAWNSEPSSSTMDVAYHSDRWKLYDNIWTIVGKISGKTSNRTPLRNQASGGPSLSQRALGLVESLNIPATEMAAAVSVGIGGAFSGRTSKPPDKAMLLRSDKFPRIIFHLLLLYLCRGSLEKMSVGIRHFCALLGNLLSYEEEQTKNRVQLFLWSLVNLRSFYEKMDDGPRVHSTTSLIFEIINCWKSVLSMSNPGIDDTLNALTNLKEPMSVLNLLQRDKVLGEVTNEIRYMKTSNSERLKQLEYLNSKIDEISLGESNQRKVLDEEVVVSMGRILASDDSRRVALQLKYDEKQQMTAERWVHMLRSLIDERGPWSANPFPSDSVTRWKLDKTEDSLRRRPKLKRNYHFDESLCHPSSNTLQPSSPVAEPFTLTGKVPDQIKSYVRKEMDGNIGDGSSETGDNAIETGRMSESEITGERNHLKTIHNATDTETNEVLLSISSVFITPKRKLAGHLAVMRNELHFFSEFLIEGTGGSSVFKHFGRSKVTESSKQEQVDQSCKQKVHKDILDRNLDLPACATDLSIVLQSQCKKIKRHRRWSIRKVKAVHWSRYLLQYTALEIFFNDSASPVFFNFASSGDAKDVGTLIVSLRNELLFPKGNSRDKGGLISIVDRRVATEMAATARESWRRREMSNFEYLMILNTLAGRSYNDLTQYPIFPWVLADYSSEKLNLNKSSTFRDLSKPVGALDLKRFQVFEDRYHSFSDPDIPSFYYGSHYSSMGIVLFYLLRLEPFTGLHRTLQGGKFDHADRLFQSIEGTYRNCLSNTSDVKELIPEFFYTPEFLMNSNGYHLGVKQDGEPLNDVLLPPWAKGSPEEFIFQHREALESEYVSSNLHHWIDLIFGYKQRGRPAVEAANVFYYLTYEGAVDLETMDDELQRSAIEDQIANFGQTPIQLFRKKHPRRGPPIPIVHPLYFAPASISLTSVVSQSSQLQSPVLFLDLIDSNIVTINKGLVLSVKMWLTTQLQSGGNFTFSSTQDSFFGIGTDVLSPRKIGTPLAENFKSGRQCFATVQTQVENYLISCGTWENSFQVISLQDGRTVQSVRQHKDVVSCVSVSSDGSILATGSYDTTVMLWNVFQGRTNERRVWAQQTDGPSPRGLVIDDSPFHILCGHDDIITCLVVSTELDIVVSGSKDATCIFHTLREGRYVRSIQHPSGCSLTRIVASGRGRVVMYAEDDLSLHLYSINGQRLASSEANGRLNCIELSGCGEFLVCAGDKGQITLRSMHSLEVVHRYEGIGKALTSLAVTPEECFLAGTRDGSLLVYSIENLQSRGNSVSKDSK